MWIDLLGQTLSFYLWNMCILWARLYVQFPFQMKRNWKNLGWWLTYGQRGQLGPLVAVVRWRSSCLIYVEHLTSQNEISSSLWTLVLSKLNTGNFTLITVPTTFSYYNLLSVQPGYVKLRLAICELFLSRPNRYLLVPKGCKSILVFSSWIS